MSAIEDARAEGGGLLSNLSETDAHRVAYVFACRGSVDDFTVTGVEAVEELNRPYQLSVHLDAVHEAIDTGELVGQDASLKIERGEHCRTFYGIVARVTIHDHAPTGQKSTIEVVPAIHALRFSEDTRNFQQKTALEIVEAVLAACLPRYKRGYDASALDAGRYLARDYCVQYRETSFDFVHRLLEEEGIGYYFRHDNGNAEQIVFFADNADLARAQTMDRGPVRYDHLGRAWAGSEPIVSFGVSVKLATSKVTVRDHDWTSARPRVEASSPSDAERNGRHAHEVYEHGIGDHLTIREDHATLSTMLDTLMGAAMPFGPPSGLAHRVHDIPGAVLDPFTTSDVAHQAVVRWEERSRDTQVFRGVGAVTGFLPGSTFELVGHPILGGDGVYVLTRVVHTSTPAERPSDVSLSAPGQNYENAFECLAVATPWRPNRRTRKPRVYGVQTARVTGPVGTDVHTDQHGRIKVRFHWDRSAEDPSGNYTCWLRVSQIWAGPGAPGFMFVPRVGMEVVVSFVDGDPDRPLVTGCVYNGENPTPGLLPVQATKSILRTRTIPHGTGYNEISFEDAMGVERVHIRAQRDLDELVLNDHNTSVSGSQFNQVRRDQIERVMRHQQVEVNGNRTERVRGKHIVASNSDHRHDVGGSASTHITGDYEVAVDQGSALLEVKSGAYVATARESLTLVQSDERFIEISSNADDPGIALRAEGATVHISNDLIELKIGSSIIRMTGSVIQVNNKVFPAS